MSPTISTLLNSHPVSRNDNLRKIAMALDLNPPQEHKKVQIQSAIEDYLTKEPDLEQLVREIAQTIILDSKSTRSDSDTPMDTDNSSLNATAATVSLSRSPIRVVSIPTPPSAINTQADLFTQSVSQTDPTLTQSLENELKRKLSLGDDSSGDDDDDYDGDENETKRPRVEPYESIRKLTTFLLSEREERQRERLLSVKENETRREEAKDLRTKLDCVVNELSLVRESIAQIHETILTKSGDQQQQPKTIP